MKKLYRLIYLDKYGLNQCTHEIKAKNIKHAEDLHYKQFPYTLVIKIELVK